MTFLRSLAIGACLAVLISCVLDYAQDDRPVRVREVEQTYPPVRPEVVYGRR